MRLIADSGSTKTDWKLLNIDNSVKDIYTKGINPYMQDTDSIKKVLELELIPCIDTSSEVKEIYYYGAGCSSEQPINSVTEAIRTFFPSAKILVDHDLLGAARALCSKKSGVASILGTGSNSCSYNGEKIVKNIPSLGLYLGDEGSGGALGRKIIRAFMYQEMPIELYKSFNDEYKLTKEILLEEVYKKPLPNRYLASFALFAAKHKEHEFIQELIAENFQEFFMHHVNKYLRDDFTLFNAVGSIAFYFKEELETVALINGFDIGTIIKSPIDGLTLHHRYS